MQIDGSFLAPVSKCTATLSLQDKKFQMDHSDANVSKCNNIHLHCIKHVGKNLEVELRKHFNGFAQVTKCGKVTRQTRLFRHIRDSHKFSFCDLSNSKFRRQLTTLSTG
jgi:hypothetical protein